MVTKDMVPKIMFVPILMSIATPMVIMKSTGSNQELVVISRIRKMIGTTRSMIFWTSFAVSDAAITLSTTEPDIQFSSPMISRTAATASSSFSSSTVTENSAFPSLYHSSTVFCGAISRGS